MLLRENHTYIIGDDCSYGFYLISGKSENSDADFNQYRSLDKTGWYDRRRCYFGCVEVKAPHACITVENGSAVFLGDSPFDLYEEIDKADLTDRVYYQRGQSVYKNQICEIKVYYRDRASHYYSGDNVAEIDNQFIFSINNHYYWALFLDVKSFRNYSDLQICLKSKILGKSYVFGEGGFSYGSIKYVDFDTKGKNLKLFRVTNQEFYIMELPSGVNPARLVLSWIHPNNSSKKLLPTDKTVADLFADEYNHLATVLNKYRDLGMEIDIEDELHFMDKAPDFAELCASFLEKELSKQDLFSKKRPNIDSFYTFHVGATFDKKYYCAVKLAEKAVDIKANDENTVYYITYNAKQIEEIALMYHNLVSQFNKDKDYMVEILEHLKKYDFFTYLVNTIDLELAELREQFGYSSIVTNSVLVRIIKCINKNRNRQLTALYTEMVDEKRVATKWSSEYRLFSIIKSFVPDAIYQYRTGWLGAQSFDIYLPSYRIAIEYQGQQHYEPVEAFGGKDHFHDNVKRDARKRQLAAEHNVLVLDWEYFIPVNDDTVIQFLTENHIDVSVRQVKQVSLPTDSLLLNMAPPIENEKKRREKSKSEKPEPTISPNVIRQHNTDGHFLYEYDSVKDASEKTGVSEKSIRNVLYGVRKSGGGFIWTQCERGSPIQDVSPIAKVENTGLGKAVKQMDLDGNTIGIYPSKRSASEKTGINVRGISDAIDGIQKTAGGYKWSYFTDEDGVNS